MIGTPIQRREFITLLGGTAAAWPLAARAQQPAMRRVGVLMGYAEGDPEAQALLSVLVGALEQLGWTEGRNARIDYRWAVGNVERMRALAKELIELKPDVIVANTTPVTAALQQGTSTIPIVFVIVSDPVGAGFVATLSRPGGNITSFINVEGSFGGKWLDRRRFAVLLSTPVRLPREAPISCLRSKLHRGGTTSNQSRLLSVSGPTSNAS